MKAKITAVRIQKVIEMGVQETRHFKLVFDPNDPFDYEAGQFVNVLSEKDGKPIKRAYSIASAPFHQGEIELCWRKVQCGTLTPLLWNLKEGDRLTIQGPLGHFTLKPPLPKRLIFVSTGTGIAPFRAMIHQLLHQGTNCEIVNIFGNRFAADILYREEWEALEAAHPNLKNYFVISRPVGWDGETGYVQASLKKNISSAKDSQLFICGLSTMIQNVVDAAKEIGFTKEQIHFEKYN